MIRHTSKHGKCRTTRRLQQQEQEHKQKWIGIMPRSYMKMMTASSSSSSTLLLYVLSLLLLSSSSIIIVVSSDTTITDSTSHGENAAGSTGVALPKSSSSSSSSAISSASFFDEVDRNHDSMIDRNEYNQGIHHFLQQFHQDMIVGLRAATSSSSLSNEQLALLRQLENNNNDKSFTSWLLHDLFSYTTGSAAAIVNKNDVAAVAGSSSSSTTITTTTNISIWQGYWKAFTSSLAMILATEIGDKTFFIAAILSMKHSRSIVFIGAIVALIIMTIISTALGLILPKLLDRKYTHILSGILFLYFGCKLVYDASKMESGKVSEELEEVEEELLHKTNNGVSSSSSYNKKKKGDDDDDDLERGKTTSVSGSITSSFMMSTYTILVMSFTLTFVAEWGDRSQIATIALASAKNPIGVTIGCIVGHCICTASACIGGRILASNISEKTVSHYGGIIFLLFGFHSLFFES